MGDRFQPRDPACLAHPNEFTSYVDIQEEQELERQAESADHTQERELIRDARLAVECPPVLGGSETANEVIRRWKVLADALDRTLDRLEKAEREVDFLLSDPDMESLVAWLATKERPAESALADMKKALSEPVVRLDALGIRGPADDAWLIYRESMLLAALAASSGEPDTQEPHVHAPGLGPRHRAYKYEGYGQPCECPLGEDHESGPARLALPAEEPSREPEAQEPDDRYADGPGPFHNEGML